MGGMFDKMAAKDKAKEALLPPPEPAPEPSPPPPPPLPPPLDLQTEDAVRALPVAHQTGAPSFCGKHPSTRLLSSAVAV
jgi:hypothetical protein